MNEVQEKLSQWDNYIPPLNLWNYNLYWQWLKEWQDESLTQERKDS